RAATEAQDSLSPVLFARALTVRRGDPVTFRYLSALQQTRTEPIWTASTAAVLLGAGDTAFADSALPRLHVAGRNPAAWLLSGLVSARRGDEAAARTLLAGALAAAEFALLVDFGIKLVDAPQWVERGRQAPRR